MSACAREKDPEMQRDGANLVTQIYQINYFVMSYLFYPFIRSLILLNALIIFDVWMSASAA